MAKIAAIGEVMVELSPFPSGDIPGREVMSLSYAGDTYNTSVYMARLGLETYYVTQLGEDRYSQQIIQCMASEAIHTHFIKQLAGRAPGLYMIHNTADGEREFFYWRKEAPARELFSSLEATEILCQQLIGCDYVYFSGITLAIINEKSRQYLYHALKKLRAQGVKIAYDSNYRPRLWRNAGEAQQVMLSIMQYIDIALLTLDDEKLLWGDDSIISCKQRYASFSLQELVLKRSAEDVIIITHQNELHIPVPSVKNVIDTTGAGDSFNAGYLAGRLMGKSLEDSAKQGIRCASIIIRHRGAIVDKAIFLKELLE